jgi:hypothetical protein
MPLRGRGTHGEVEELIFRFEAERYTSLDLAKS